MVFTVVAATGGAYAATGGTFILGKANTAGATTSLTNRNGSALALNAKAGQPALKVNTGAMVKNLNSDRLDGLHRAAFQRRVSGTCATDAAIRAIGSGGGVACVPVGSAAPAVADVQDLDGLTCESPGGDPGTTKVSVGDLLPNGNGFYEYPVKIVCQYEWPADGTACDDGDPTTTDDIYTNGECQGTPPELDCDDGDPYTADVYDAGSQSCTHEATAQDFDGDTFTAEQAQGGTPDCNDGNPSIHPDAPEIIDNAVDDDCDGDVDEPGS